MHDSVDGLEDVLGKLASLFVDVSNLRAIHVDIINQLSLEAIPKPEFWHSEC